MAISRTPKKEPDSIFTSPTAQLFEDVDGEDNKQKESDRVAELEQALKDLRAQREEERSDALLSQPSTWQSQVNDTGYVEVKPETIALPDPALDPDGYDAALARRNEIRDTNRRNKEDFQRRRNDDIDTKTTELWADFGDEYPDYAADKERIDYIATQVVKAAVKKNLDVQRYMFGAGRSRFMKDVTKKYDKVFGEPEVDEANDDDFENAPPRRSSKSRDLSSRNSRSRRRSEDDDEGRSVGVFGGNESGGRTSRRNVDAEDGPSMLDDIHAMQRKTGFW